MAKIIKADGSEIEVRPTNKTFSLEEMQKIVGGYIEIVYLKDGRLMILNEEGKLNNLPINKRATTLYNNSSDYIVGDVLVCDRNQVD